jgi:gamma-glutamyl:cysteine ligase YbdK (ATP-grasp superfamily)
VRGHDNEPVRRSVEVEYWVIDDEGRLVEPGELVAASPGAEREFVEPLLEIKTTPCESTAALREELFERLRAVLERADDLGRGLVPLATPINAEEIAELPSDRTWMQNRVVGDDFAYVRHCAGTHIHVEQQPGRVVDQLNTLIALDPALALSNSTPYFRGRRVAAGARSKLYRRLAYADLDHQGRLWPYVESTDEWTARLERRYEEFVAAAVEAGVDRDRVEAVFDPESAVWTPVQIRAEFGTVEWRSPDTTLPGQVVRLADDIASVVEVLRDVAVRIGGETGQVSSGGIVLPRFEAVTEYVDRAIAEGLAAPAVRSYLDRMGFDVSGYQPVTHDLARDGGDAVSAAAARRHRLDHADRLRRSVRRARPPDAD